MKDDKEWLKMRLEYLLPVIIVLVFASLLAYSSYLAEVTMKAVVVQEEGGSSQQASAGLLNALIYIIPAVIGGFLIYLLFKYRKQYTLRVFFSSAIFFASTFITFFFLSITTFVVQVKSYGMVIINPYSSIIPANQPYILYYSPIEDLIIPLSIVIGVVTTYVISSNKFFIDTKNSALLFLGGLLGAFLAVILPTWTVVFMLVLLSVYDIYSVRKGPIRKIMEHTYGPSIPPKPPSSTSTTKKSAASSKVKATGTPTNQQEVYMGINGAEYWEIPAQNKPAQPAAQSPPDDELLSSMTYGTKHWDLGIGDLVFYSMLGAHVLVFGTRFIPEFGMIAPISLFLATTFGIILGFGITLKLLSRNPMLPGLPMSIFLGLICFGIGIGVFYLL